MIAHVILFRPKAELTDAQRRTFVRVFEQALVDIPAIARARIGRRRTLGRAYDAQNLQDYPFVAILEFNCEGDLLAYLEHPAHRLLGEQFYVTAESALALDFELLEGDWSRELLS